MRLHPNWSRPLIAAVVCLALGAGAWGADPKPAKPAEKTSRTRGKTPIPEALQKAIDALAEEFQPLLKNAESASPTMRTASDYFKSNSITVTPDELLSALSRRLHKDPRVDAYVKWQLLSAHPDQFSGAHAKEALQLYRNAPHNLPPRPGSTPRDQQALNAQIAGVRKDDVEAANVQWRQMLDFHMRQYRPMIAYREELYNRLPKTPEVFAAALQDMHERMMQGYNFTGYLRIVLTDIRTSAAEMKSNEILQLSGMLRRVANTSGVRTYEELEVRKDGKVAWKLSAQPVGFEARAVNDTVAALEEMAKAG